MKKVLISKNYTTKMVARSGLVLMLKFPYYKGFRLFSLIKTMQNYSHFCYFGVILE